MKILFVASSSDPGFWLSELTHPYWQLASRDCEIDLASPAGGALRFDPMSDPFAPGTWGTEDLVSRGFLSHEKVVAQLHTTLPLNDVSSHGYDAIHIVGGRGAAVDLYPNEALGGLLDDFWSAGKVIGAISEGVIALANIPHRIAGRRATGSSRWEDAEMEELHGRAEMPSWPQFELEKAGVDFIHDRAWGRRVMIDGRLITAQNQMSSQAYSVAFDQMLFGNGIVFTTYRNENFSSVDSVAAE